MLIYDACVGVGPRYRCAAGVAGHQLRPPHQPRAVHTPHRPVGSLRAQGRGHQLRQGRGCARAEGHRAGIYYCTYYTVDIIR